MIEKKPYVRYDLKEKEKDKFSVKFDEKGFSREFLAYWKDKFDCDMDSTVTKRLALIGAKVILNTFGEDILKYLLNKDRVRYDLVGRK